MDEYQVGDKITVTKWISRQDRSWCGDVLELLAIDGQFLAVKRLNEYEFKFSLNLMEVEVQKLSEEYVNVMTSK